MDDMVALATRNTILHAVVQESGQQEPRNLRRHRDPEETVEDLVGVESMSAL
jgi:hypothetical protein